MEYYRHSADKIRDMNIDTEITQSLLDVLLLTSLAHKTERKVLNSNYVGGGMN